MKAPDAFRTISEVAEDLDLPQHVLRFWETRFTQIKPMKRGGGRRYYRPEDVQLLRGIRLLLYAEGFTIRGVQRLLKEKGVGFVAGVGQSGSMQTLAAQAIVHEVGADEPLPPAGYLPVESEGASVPLEPMQDVAASSSPDDRSSPEGAGSRSGGFALAPEGLRRLESAVVELLEAQRLLEQVR